MLIRILEWRRFTKRRNRSVSQKSTRRPANNTNIKLHSGLFAIKDYRDAVNQDDMNKAVRKVAESKKLEGKLEYQKL